MVVQVNTPVTHLAELISGYNRACGLVGTAGDRVINPVNPASDGVVDDPDVLSERRGNIDGLLAGQSSG